MTIEDYYFDDPRLILLPIEHLTPGGLRPAFAALLTARLGWDRTLIELFNTAFSRYWERTTTLAARASPAWAPPRLRHVGLVRDPRAVLPYVQLLNTSTWTLYESDFDPAVSNPEFGAYLLVHGDRMARTGEVTTAAVHNAAYWLDRTDAECAAFAAAAARSTRPDAGAFRALAAATNWLRQLSHETLRPPALVTGQRLIPGTGLLVPRDLQPLPPALVEQWTKVAQETVGAFHAWWKSADRGAAEALCGWLVQRVPQLLVGGRGGRIIWDPQAPDRLGPLRHELRQACGAAVRDLATDLQVIDQRSRAFHDALIDPNGLPPPDPRTEQGGYVYLHRDRGLIAYNLHEPGFDRLHAPALPYARAMLGARTVHEWTHLAVDAGWVPQAAQPEQVADRTSILSDQLTEVIAAAPRTIRERTSSDLQALIADARAHQPPNTTTGESAGRVLVHLLTARMPDYQANLLGQRFMSLTERETYVRHNIRTLRAEYRAEQLWRLLVRYLYEYQYLTFSAVPDKSTFFLRSTWFDADFIVPGILSEAQFAALTAAVAHLCDTYKVDESRFRTTQQGQPDVQHEFH